MSKKKIAIIGAGIAGLAAGCYARMNGYPAEIYEMHSMAGGLCTAWKRKGYTFDGCIHWLVGTRGDRFFHKVWDELGVLEGKGVHYFEEFVRAEDDEGRSAVLYSDPDRLLEHFSEISPEDKERTVEFVRLIKLFSRFDMSLDKPAALYGPADLLKMMRQMKPFMKDFKRISSVTVGEYAEKFRHPLLRRVLTSLIPAEYSLSSLIITLGDYSSKNAGFPEGGSLSFASSLERRFEALGGKIHYGKRVVKIIPGGKRVEGIELEDGKKVDSDIVISAADGRTTWYELIGEKHLPEKIRRYYEDTEKYKTFTSLQVYLGVNCDLSEEPETLSVSMTRPLEIAGQTHDSLLFHHYCHEKSLAPDGKSVVMVLAETPFEYWEKLSESREEYEKEKKRIADEVREGLEKRFPRTRGKIETVDVVTPMTYVRYTGVWKGAYMSWLMTPRGGRIMVPNRVKGLSGFYTAGIWTMPSGLPSAALTGRWAVQQICRKDGCGFRTEPV